MPAATGRCARRTLVHEDAGDDGERQKNDGAQHKHLAGHRRRKIQQPLRKCNGDCHACRQAQSNRENQRGDGGDVSARLQCA